MIRCSSIVAKIRIRTAESWWSPAKATPDFTRSDSWELRWTPGIPSSVGIIRDSEEVPDRPFRCKRRTQWTQSFRSVAINFGFFFKFRFYQFLITARTKLKKVKKEETHFPIVTSAEFIITKFINFINLCCIFVVLNNLWVSLFRHIFI